MDIKISKEQLYRVSNLLLDKYFKGLTPIRGNVDFELLFLNPKGDVVIGISTNFPKDDMEKYINGKRKRLRSYPDDENYLYIYPSIIKNMSNIFPPFRDERFFKEYFEKYFYKNYGIRVDFNHHNSYAAHYLNRERDYLNNN